MVVADALMVGAAEDTAACYSVDTAAEHNLDSVLLGGPEEG